jgi:hypothetical protein
MKERKHTKQVSVGGDCLKTQVSINLTATCSVR